MAIIKWTDNLELGIVSIDNQHKRLVNIINRFHVLLEQNSTHNEITSLLIELKQYTKSHFSNEESFLKKYNFEHLEEHQQEHERFIKEITDLEHLYKTDQIQLSIEITNFLKNWLIDHIQGSDMKYLKFFKDNNIL